MKLAISLPQTHRLALAETALAVLFWALSFVFIKIALRQLSPIALLTARFAISALFLGLISLMNGQLKSPPQKGLIAYAFLGALAIVLQQYTQVRGQVSLNVGVCAFLAAISPALVVILAGAFLRESLHLWQLVGVLLATFGAGVVSLEGHWTGLGQLSEGSLWMLLSALIWAIYTILCRKAFPGRSATLGTALMMALACLFLLPLFLAEHSATEFPTISLQTLLALIFTGIFGTGLAFFLYNHALKLSQASRLAAIQNLEPALTALAAFLLIGETVSGSLLAGGLAILCGVYLAEH